MVRRGALVLLAAVAAVAALFGVRVAGAGAAVPDARVAGSWHLDTETLCPPEGSCTHHTLDSSGRGNDLDVLGSPTLVTGRFGKAFAFGSDGVLARSATPSLKPQRLTVLAWVKATAPGADKYVLAQGFGPSCSGAATYALETDQSGGLLFYVWNGTDPLAAKSPDVGAGIWDGKWHAVAGRYDGSTVRLYVDGSQVGSGTPASPSISYALGGPTDLLIGSACTRSQTSNPFHFPGAIDEVRVYNEALSSFQIHQLETSAGPSPPTTPADKLTAELSVSPNPTCVGSSTYFDASGSSGPAPIVKYRLQYTEAEGSLAAPNPSTKTYVFLDGPSPSGLAYFGWNRSVPWTYGGGAWGGPLSVGVREPVDVDLTVADSTGATATTSRHITFLTDDSAQDRDPRCTADVTRARFPFGVKDLKKITLTGGGSALSVSVPCKVKLTCAGTLAAIGVGPSGASAVRGARHHPFVVAVKSFVIPAGKHRRVKARLTKRARRRLHKRRHLRVKEALIFNSGSGPVVRSRKVTLRLRHKH